MLAALASLVCMTNAFLAPLPQSRGGGAIGLTHPATSSSRTTSGVRALQMGPLNASNLKKQQKGGKKSKGKGGGGGKGDSGQPRGKTPSRAFAV